MTTGELQKLADEDLMTQVAAKDPRAFEVFYDRHGGAAFSLNKAGAGLWMLGNAANTYSGQTTITGGALQASSGTSLPTNSALVLK